MIKTVISTLFLLLPNFTLAQATTQFDPSGFITRDHALSCIQINRDIDLSRQQSISTVNANVLQKSKIHYLETQIHKHRQLIEKLDQKRGQENSEDYNRLIIQFETLVDERKLNISLYKKGTQLLFTQQQSTVRLQQRLTKQCESNVKISQKMFNEVCVNVSLHWCEKFKS